MTLGHRVIVIIAHSSGRTCGRQRHADAGGRRRSVVHPACGTPIALSISPSPLQQGSRRRLSGSLRCGRVRPTPARWRHAPCSIRCPWGPASCLCSAGSAGGARPTPPSNSGGGWAAPEAKTERWSLRSDTCFIPPHPPRWGGFNPPRPLPGGAEGGPPAGPPAAPSGRPARWRAGSARVRRPPGILPGGTAAVLAAPWSARRRPVGGRGPRPPSARPRSRHGPPAPGLSGRRHSILNIVIRKLLHISILET